MLAIRRPRPAARRRFERPRNRVLLRLEELESRTVPSVFAPAQIRHAYGFDQLQLTGANQTIAIVDAYDDPNIAGDFQTFSNTFGITGGSLTKATPQGQPSADSGWATEIALDVEWAHAIAPGANILLVEAKSSSFADMLGAVDYAANNASVVSMSWGAGEFSAEVTAAYDGHFKNHPGVTFVAASGDSGRPATWPAVSPSVLSVGGTALTFDTNGNYLSEKGWGNGGWSFYFGGSGGGISKYEPKPAYQNGVANQSTTKRLNPDVAYNADPNTGFYVLDSYNGGWFSVGGTSAGAPQWAALIALANEARTTAGRGTLDGITQTLPAIYKMAASDFHDITTGNNGYAAGPGYDLVTGRGTPKANLVVAALASADASGGVGGMAAAPATGSGSPSRTVGVKRTVAPVNGPPVLTISAAPSLLPIPGVVAPVVVSPPPSAPAPASSMSLFFSPLASASLVRVGQAEAAEVSDDQPLPDSEPKAAPAQTPPATTGTSRTDGFVENLQFEEAPAIAEPILDDAATTSDSETPLAEIPGPAGSLTSAAFLSAFVLWASWRPQASERRREYSWRR